jgi:hypothetical protein
MTSGAMIPRITTRYVLTSPIMLSFHSNIYAGSNTSPP